MISIDLSTIKKPAQGVGLGRARDMIKKLKWGGIPVSPQVFGVNSSSIVPTSYNDLTWYCPASDICPSALHHRESRTLARSRRAYSVTHRKSPSRTSKVLVIAIFSFPFPAVIGTRLVNAPSEESNLRVEWSGV